MFIKKLNDSISRAELGSRNFRRKYLFPNDSTNTFVKPKVPKYAL